MFVGESGVKSNMLAIVKLQIYWTTMSKRWQPDTMLSNKSWKMERKQLSCPRDLVEYVISCSRVKIGFDEFFASRYQ